jgi:hypothetical protein
MIFCDGVILEQGTGKVTLVGTFSGLAATTFPSPPKDLHVYIQLTSFHGDVTVRLACMRVDVAEPEEIAATTHAVHFRGKLIVEQLHFVWSQFQFPTPGEYAVQLWCQDQCLAERRLTVISALPNGASPSAPKEAPHETQETVRQPTRVGCGGNLRGGLSPPGEHLPTQERYATSPQGRREKA